MTSTVVEATLPKPTAPATVADTGVPADLVSQLLLKTLNAAGELTGIELADRMGVEFPIIEPGIEWMKTERLCEIVGGTILGSPSYRYRITYLGREQASRALERNMYTGTVPVPMTQYHAYMKAFQGATRHTLRREDVRRAFSHLVLTDRTIDQVGPAVNAGHSMFIYGPPGNGKTVIAQAIRNLMTEEFWIPYALEVDGSIVQVFDPVNHERMPEPEQGMGLESTTSHDRRWVRCRRPSVMVGGELTLEQLELGYDPNAGFYRAPVHLLANGGLLIIDDFGRQQISPYAILNRWITPLESRIDFLTLQSGQKVAVPFMVLPVFATNIRPAELVDEAFLRRIQYKILAEDPTPEMFREIWRRYCAARKLEPEPAILDDLLERLLPSWGARLAGCQPRDLIEQSLARARYLGLPERVTTGLLEEACATYFVDAQSGVARA